MMHLNASKSSIELLSNVTYWICPIYPFAFFLSFFFFTFNCFAPFLLLSIAVSIKAQTKCSSMKNNEINFSSYRIIEAHQSV